MSLPWQSLNLDLTSRLLQVELADGSVALAFAPSLQANGHDCGLPDATVEAPAGELPDALDLPLRFHTPPLDWTLHLQRADEGRTLLISSTVFNPGPEAVRLGECRLVQITPDQGKLEIVGDDGAAVFLGVSGTTRPARVKRAASGEENMSRTLLQLVSNAAGRAVHLGFVTYDRMETTHRFTYDEAGVKSLSAVCDFQDHELAAGQSIHTETLMMEVQRDLHESLQQLGRPRGRALPAHDLAEDTRRLAWLVVGGCLQYRELRGGGAAQLPRHSPAALPDFDIEYVWVSIGNLQDGYPGNWLEWDYGNFPGGPEHLVSELGELGFKLGFWCGAFWVCAGGEEKLEQLEDARLKRNGEPVVAVPHWNYGAAARLPLDERPPIYSLDPTHPKARDVHRQRLRHLSRVGDSLLHGGLHQRHRLPDRGRGPMTSTTTGR